MTLRPPRDVVTPVSGAAPIQDEMIGRTLGHYRVEERLGAGGMGIVYRGRDLHLDRDVALKVLPSAALADESHRRRFRREAVAVSRLAHPHIGMVFDFDAQDGVDYLVLELVPGETLARRIARGPMALDHVADVGMQIADALDAAHEHGIVHRDLKPENVMVTPRCQAKVLDFGLARSRAPEEAAGGARLTEADVVMGTLPYMAPEQLLGGVVDPRTDVFALGALLYEMSTGVPPFTERLSTALVHEILNRAPKAPRSVRAEIPMGLESVILRALEKDPTRRFASAGEVREALAPLARGAADVALEPSAPRLGSIAVLPLENLSHDPEQDWFADGMTESLIAELARLKGLRVVSRTSAMRFKGANRPLTEIARELGVDGIVEGSVMRSGGRVRITARLIDGLTEQVLWGNRYERDLSDVLALQADLAITIANAIRSNVDHDERAHAVGRTVDPEAYEAYLRGRWHWNRRTEESLRKAIEFFERAIERDPTYALAYSGLADGYNILADNNWVPPEAGFPRARAAAQRALELDPTLAEAHASLAYVTFFQDWNWEKADQQFRRSLELAPDYPSAHQWYASLLTSLGRFDEGVAESRRAVELDPMATILLTSLGDSLYYARRYDEAIRQARHALELDPTFYLAWTDLARAYEQAGRFEESIEAYRRGAELQGRDPGVSTGMACAYGFAGRRDEATAILERVVERAKTAHVPSYSIASIHASLGDNEAALAWLEKAYQNHDRAMIWLRVNPRFTALWQDPRFADVEKRVGFPS